MQKMTKLEQRRYNAMNYLAKVNPEQYKLGFDDEKHLALFECWETRFGEHSRPIATIKKDIKYYCEV
jgi:hypothetical protein